MFPQIDSESRLNQPKLSRRRLLGMGAGIAAGLVLFGTVDQPREAYAEVSSWPIIGDNEEFFPLLGGKLTAPDGPLDRYDQTYGTRVRSFFEDYRRWALNESKDAKAIANGEKVDTRGTWGSCDDVAKVRLDLGEQVALGLDQNKAKLAIQDNNLLGVLVAYYSGSADFRPELHNIAANNQYFIENLIKNKQAFIGRIKEGDYVLGDWYRVVHGITDDHQRLLVTGLGKTAIEIPASRLEFSFLPERLEEARANGRSEFILNENKGFRTNELDEKRAYEYTGLR